MSVDPNFLTHKRATHHHVYVSSDFSGQQVILMTYHELELHLQIQTRQL